jgi:hypothetical protein
MGQRRSSNTSENENQEKNKTAGNCAPEKQDETCRWSPSTKIWQRQWGTWNKEPAEEIELERDRENQQEHKPRFRISTRRNSDLEKTQYRMQNWFFQNKWDSYNHGGHQLPSLFLLETINYLCHTSTLRMRKWNWKVARSHIHSSVLYIGPSKRLNDYYAPRV